MKGTRSWCFGCIFRRMFNSPLKINWKKFESILKPFVQLLEPEHHIELKSTGFVGLQVHGYFGSFGRASNWLLITFVAIDVLQHANNHKQTKALSLPTHKLGRVNPIVYHIEPRHRSCNFQRILLLWNCTERDGGDNNHTSWRGKAEI